MAPPSAAMTLKPKAIPLPEDQLILKARSGDSDAFREIVRRFTPRVFAVARNLVSNAGDAEDVVQEVFFKVHRKLSSFREDAAFGTWLYRVTVNTAADSLKKRRQDHSVTVDDLGQLALVDPADGPDESLGRRNLRREIRKAMSCLPEKFRTIIVLRELEGLSYQEISRIIGCSKGTVESRLFRARARLRDLLERSLRKE